MQDEIVLDRATASGSDAEMQDLRIVYLRRELKLALEELEMTSPPIRSSSRGNLKMERPTLRAPSRLARNPS